MGLFGPPNIEKMKAKRDVDGLIKALQYKIKSTDFKETWVRQDAAKALGEIGESSAVLPLIAALNHRDNGVRWEAALGLGKIGDARAVEPLIAALKDSGLCIAAAVALGRIGSAHAVEPLISVLGDKDAKVRVAAAEALGKIGDTRAVEPLIAALEDKDFEVRKAVVEALGKIGDLRAVEPLLACAYPWSSERFEQRQLREAAQKILDQVCRDDVKPLIAALRSDSSGARNMAVTMLDKQGSEILSGEDKAWYLAAKEDWEHCAALGRIALEPLRTALLLRWEGRGAAKALAEINDPRSVAILLEGLKKYYTRSYIGDEIVEALDQLGWRPGRDEDGARYWLNKRRWDKYFEIGAPGPELLVEEIKDLGNEFWKDLLNLVALLSKLGDSRAIAPLIALLSHRDYDVSNKAADALTEIGTPAVDELLLALREKHSREIAKVLGRIGDGRAVEPVLDILSSWRFQDYDFCYALANLYRSRCLSEAQKNLILSHATKMERPHDDMMPQGWDDSVSYMYQHVDVPAIRFD
jgi:HEAT repeat protein